MKLSWSGLILAPLPVPLVIGILLTISVPGRSPLWSFFFFFALSSLVSYGTTLFLFLPCLYMLSKRMTLSWRWVCLLGIVLGAAAFLLCAWLGFQSSGPNSGPPEGTFLEFLVQSRGDAITWLFPLAGLVTAALYWFLTSRPPRRNIQEGSKGSEYAKT